MKRFIVSTLCVAVFFIGLGSLVDRAGASFKSDEKALELIRQARVAIGGEANITAVRGLTIVGKTTNNFEIEGAQKSEPGELEINLQLPNQFSKQLKIGNGGDADATAFRKEMDVIVTRKAGEATRVEQLENGDGQKRTFVIKRGEGEPVVLNSENLPADGKHTFIIKKDGENVEALAGGDGKIVVDKMLRASTGGVRQNELFRTTFALLLSAPEGTDVSYTYAGEADVEGNSCNVVVAQTGGESYKLFLDKSTSLPRMLTYQAVKPLMIKINKEEGKSLSEQDKVKFVRRAESLEKAEYQMKFSDYRTVGGVQLPYKWTQSTGGQVEQTVDVTSYDVNPANIADKFQAPRQRVMVRPPQAQ